jgi:hypothetical protein
MMGITRSLKVCSPSQSRTTYSCRTELSEEDKQKLQAGYYAVRAALPADTTSQISDRQITDVLWHYYYDVEKSVNYLVGTVKKENVKKEAEKPKIQGAFYFRL